VRGWDPDACCSSSRTCEMGLARASGRVWRSFLHVVEEATRGGADREEPRSEAAGALDRLREPA